jgi:hypothetical protein
MKNAKLNNELARPIGIVDGTSVGGTRRPRVTTRGLTDCVCYDADGNVIRTIARTTRTNSYKTAQKKNRVRIIEDTYSYSDRLAQFGAIGNVE